MCNKFTSRMAWAGMALCLMLGTVAFSTRAAQGSDAPAAKAAEGNIDVVIKGQVYKGEIVLPCTETEFKFKIAGLESTAFRWSDLDEFERKRVQKLYGMEVKDDGRQVFGEKAEGVRWKLKSDKYIEGLRIPDHDRLGMKALRTASMPLMLIPDSEIVTEDKIECYESDFYSPMEVYQRKMLEQPPGSDDAAANLLMAKWCANIQLYAVAIDHLEKAKIIDPRTEERNSDFRGELVKLAANKGGSDLYLMMVREVNGQDFLSAFDHLQRFDRGFAATDIKSRVDMLRDRITEGMQKTVNKQIVTMSYRVAMDLVQSKLFTKLRIDEKGNIVPSIPGKQVTTKQGHYFRGTLISIGGVAVEQTDDAYEKADPSAKDPKAQGTAAAKAPGTTQGDVSLKSGDTTINIPGKDILSIVDCDLSESKGTAEASFDELKAYVTEADGLKKEMIQKISKLVKMSTADVQKIFDGRLAKTIDYKDGNAVINNNYANFHDADYGIGSWLRPGAPKPIKYIKKDKNQPSAQRNGGGRFGNQQRTQQQQQTAQDEEETADSTDDPAIWWKFQTGATKLKVLQAWAAEKVFKTTLVSTIACPTCGNKGMLGMNQPGGNDMMQRCPTCRGSGLLYKIQYH